MAGFVSDDVFASRGAVAGLSRGDTRGLHDFTIFVVTDFLLRELDHELAHLVFISIGNTDEKLLHLNVAVSGCHLDGIDAFG